MWRIVINHICWEFEGEFLEAHSFLLKLQKASKDVSDLNGWQEEVQLQMKENNNGAKDNKE